MFAEDIDLLPASTITGIVRDCLQNAQSSHDLLNGLFRQMNSKTPAKHGRYAGIPYFNGGLFAETVDAELNAFELELIGGENGAASQLWTKVNPAIYGTLFEQSMGAKTQHQHGRHFTSEADIERIVGPTIVRPWQARSPEVFLNASGNPGPMIGFSLNLVFGQLVIGRVGSMRCPTTLAAPILITDCSSSSRPSFAAVARISGMEKQVEAIAMAGLVGLIAAFGRFDRNDGQCHGGISNQTTAALPSEIPSNCWYAVICRQSDWDAYTRKSRRKQLFTAHSGMLWEGILVTPTDTVLKSQSPSERPNVLS